MQWWAAVLHADRDTALEKAHAAQHLAARQSHDSDRNSRRGTGARSSPDPGVRRRSLDVLRSLIALAVISVDTSSTPGWPCWAVRRARARTGPRRRGSVVARPNRRVARPRLDDADMASELPARRRFTPRAVT